MDMRYLYVIIVTIVGFCIIRGIKRGLILELISLCNLFICIILTFSFFESLAQYIDRFFISSFWQQSGNIPFTAISFVTNIILFFILSSFLSNKIFGKLRIKLLYLIDRLGGMILGVIKGFLIASLILIILFMLPASSSILKDKRSHNIERKIYLIAPKVYEYLVKVQPSDFSFDSKVFLDTYGEFLAEED